MKTLANKYSHVTLFSLGKTYEGRDHLGVKISSGGTNKPAILVDAGIHAREWMAPMQGLYIINQLAENPNAAAAYKNVDWYIVPVLNPDGYEYTHTNVSTALQTFFTKSENVDVSRNVSGGRQDPRVVNAWVLIQTATLVSTGTKLVQATMNVLTSTLDRKPSPKSKQET